MIGEAAGTGTALTGSPASMPAGTLPHLIGKGDFDAVRVESVRSAVAQGNGGGGALAGAVAVIPLSVTPAAEAQPSVVLLPGQPSQSPSFPFLNDARPQRSPSQLAVPHSHSGYLMPQRSPSSPVNQAALRGSSSAALAGSGSLPLSASRFRENPSFTLGLLQPVGEDMMKSSSDRLEQTTKKKPTTKARTGRSGFHEICVLGGGKLPKPVCHCISAGVLLACGLANGFIDLQEMAFPIGLSAAVGGLYAAAVLMHIAFAVLTIRCNISNLSPVVVTVSHGVIGLVESWWLEGHHSWEPSSGWARCCVLVACWQSMAMALFPASKVTWLLLSWALLAAMLAAELPTRSVPWGYVIQGVLPYGALCSACAVALGKGLDASAISSLRNMSQVFQAELIKGYAKEMDEVEVLRRCLQPILESLGKPTTESRKGLALKEILLASKGKVEEAHLVSSELRSLLALTFDALIVEVGRSRSNQAISGSEILSSRGFEAEPAMVQEYVLENLMPFSPVESMSSQHPLTLVARNITSGPLPKMGSSRSEGNVPCVVPANFDIIVKGMTAVFAHCEPPPSQPRLQLELAATADAAIRNHLQLGLGKWGFDLFAFAGLCENRPLTPVGLFALRYEAEALQFDLDKLASFFMNLEARYHSSNSYHNSTHAADVVNSMYYFQGLQSNVTSALNPVERVTALVAAAAHDVGHDGKANRYHMVAETPLALLYNDQSSLENMHCAILFAILRTPGNSFLETLTGAEWAMFRASIVEMILDTDLARHLQAVSKFRQDFLSDNKKDPKEEENLTPAHRKDVMRFVLKACDVGGSSKPFFLHAKWATKINEEFFNQGDLEKQASLPCSPFCDRAATNVSDSQRGFYNFIVSPLYTSLNDFLRSKRVKLEVLNEIERNLEFWKKYDHTLFNYEDPQANIPALMTLFHEYENALPMKGKATTGGSTLRGADTGTSSRNKAVLFRGQTAGDISVAVPGTPLAVPEQSSSSSQTTPGVSSLAAATPEALRRKPRVGSDPLRPGALGKVKEEDGGGSCDGLP